MPKRKTPIRAQKPKQRNWVAKVVRDPDGPYRPRSERDRSKYSRRPKHPKQVDYRVE